jgi:hypothetical protein
MQSFSISLRNEFVFGLFPCGSDERFFALVFVGFDYLPIQYFIGIFDFKGLKKVDDLGWKVLEFLRAKTAEKK